jgi:hypothetical protein
VCSSGIDSQEYPVINHPYKAAQPRAFWKRAFEPDWESTLLGRGAPLICRGETVASAGSCFAANIVPYLERAGFEYVRQTRLPPEFAAVAADNFNYSRFSAAYGNIYTARQAVQLLRRALGRFRPLEDRWIAAPDLIIDPFRPGLKYPACSQCEFDLLNAQHLQQVLHVIRCADVFIFTLGLTEAWLSAYDGAVFPACPGTVAGTFDSRLHKFHNFSVTDVIQDLADLTDLLTEINPRVRLILTVSPVPLVATATGQHVLVANTYSKSVLRVAASATVAARQNVAYFPAYELVSGPQAPHDSFGPDRREPTRAAIEAVMNSFLSCCEPQGSGIRGVPPAVPADPECEPAQASPCNLESHLSAAVAAAQCEEAAAEL